jgi:hypothetical protein
MSIVWETIPDIFVSAPAQSGIVGRIPTLKSVTVYGLGHLGSWVILSLAKLGIRDITLNDFDSLEQRNVSGSIYNTQELGMVKTEVILHRLQAEMFERGQEQLANIFGSANRSLGYAVGNYRNFGFTYQPPSDFYIIATDNAWSRKRIAETIFKTWDMTKHMKRLQGINPVLIDIRSAGAKMTVLNLPILDKELRERYLVELTNLAAEPGDIPCNEANIIQVPMYISAIVAQIVTSFCKGVERYKMWTGSLETLDTVPYCMDLDLHLPKLKK